MSEYTATLTVRQTAELLRGAGSLVLTTHAKPDGDAWGSVVALAHVLRTLGKTVHAYFMPPVPEQLASIESDNDAQLFQEGDALPDADLLVILDTGAWAQLAPMRSQIEPRLDHTLIIDHHLSGDVPAPMRCIDGSAAAAAEIVSEVIDALAADSGDGTLYNDTVNRALFVGIASDTGWFRFSNTRPFTHQLAARLLEAGVDHAALYALTEQGERPEKLKLMIRAIDSLQLHAGNRVAVMCLKREDFDDTGALTEETERFVDVPQIVGAVQVVVLVTEPRDNGGAIRISFRSKPGPDAVNVADLAAKFGGGGHARAAGAKVSDVPLDELLQQITQAATDAVEQLTRS